MTHDDNFEEYLRKMLSNSISSLNPSEEAKARARKLSPSYFKDLKEKLLIEYEGKGRPMLWTARSLMNPMAKC